MRILGIETSCDETGAAVVEGGSRDDPVKVLSSVVASSEEFHKKTGGIVPEVAARKQIECILPVICEALSSTAKESYKSYDEIVASLLTKYHLVRGKHGSIVNDIDAIAVTSGPGLVGSLLIGVETAKALSFAWEKPIIPVNHLLAHLYAGWIEQETPKQNKLATGLTRNNKQVTRRGRERSVPEFLAVGLVASGGHTDLVLMEGHKKLKYLGRTRDDAAGEAFDKIARMLGLGYPGGPAIARVAMEYPMTNNRLPINLPRPMIDSGDYDFSFSGLKTAVLRQVVKVEKVDKVVREIAYEVQEAICEVLVTKVMQAVEEFKPKSIIVAGGVAANSRLRQLLKFKIQNLKFKIDLYIPPASLCTDNAASIAAAAFYNQSPIPWQKIKVDPGLSIDE